MDKLLYKDTGKLIKSLAVGVVILGTIFEFFGSIYFVLAILEELWCLVFVPFATIFCYLFLYALMAILFGFGILVENAENTLKQIALNKQESESNDAEQDEEDEDENQYDDDEGESINENREINSIPQTLTKEYRENFKK